MGRRKSSNRYETQNNKLRPPLMRKPRKTDRTYFYCPYMLSASDDIPSGAEVKLVGLPEMDGDPFVMVEYDHEQHRVMWSDLRL